MLKPDWPQLSVQFGAHFGAFSTCRTGGVSLAPYGDGTAATGLNPGGFNLGDHVGDQFEHVLINRALLAQALPNEPKWLSQVHGTSVLNFDQHQNSLIADACITTQANVVCAVLTADCLPVLFCDAKHGVVGAAHAGWRGLADGILENTISTMQAAGANSEHILAWLGPAIGPSKFEVGEEVRARFVEADASAALAFKSIESHARKYYADIYHLARLRLHRAGVHQISGGHFCTFSEPEKFYSYRRDGVTGRMTSLIWIK